MENKSIFYKAIVCSEPTVMGGIQVRIPRIHGIPNTTINWIKDEALPYAYPATQFRAEDYGQNITPLVGTQVYVAFFDDSNLIYFGNAIPSSNMALSARIKDVFLGNTVPLSKPYTIIEEPYQTTIFKSFKGSTIEISDQDCNEFIRIVGPQGGSITIGNRTYVPQRRGTTLETYRWREKLNGDAEQIPLDSYIYIDDGKGNTIKMEDNSIKIDGNIFINKKKM